MSDLNSRYGTVTHYLKTVLFFNWWKWLITIGWFIFFVMHLGMPWFTLVIGNEGRLQSKLDTTNIPYIFHDKSQFNNLVFYHNSTQESYDSQSLTCKSLPFHGNSYTSVMLLWTLNLSEESDSSIQWTCTDPATMWKPVGSSSNQFLLVRDKVSKIT